MKRLILPILGFLVITLALSFYWEEAGGRQAYAVFLKTKGAGLLDVLGIEGVRVAGGRVCRHGAAAGRVGGRGRRG